MSFSDNFSQKIAGKSQESPHLTTKNPFQTEKPLKRFTPQNSLEMTADTLFAFPSHRTTRINKPVDDRPFPADVPAFRKITSLKAAPPARRLCVKNQTNQEESPRSRYPIPSDTAIFRRSCASSRQKSAQIMTYFWSAKG